MIKLNKIYNEDNLITLKRIEDNFIDLTITSPPYNVKLGNNFKGKEGYDIYEDNKNIKDIKYLILLKINQMKSFNKI